MNWRAIAGVVILLIVATTVVVNEAVLEPIRTEQVRQGDRITNIESKQPCREVCQRQIAREVLRLLEMGLDGPNRGPNDVGGAPSGGDAAQTGTPPVQSPGVDETPSADNGTGGDNDSGGGDGGGGDNGGGDPDPTPEPSGALDFLLDPLLPGVDCHITLLGIRVCT